MVTSETIGKVAAALLAAQKEMGDAKKGSSNPFYKSKYADLNSIREAVLPPLNANGISVLQLGTSNAEGKQFIRTLLLHESGEFIGSDTEVVVAKQNDPQAYGSAQSYARRYGLQAAVCVGADDDDGNKASGKVSKNEEPPKSPVVETKTEAAPEQKQEPVKPAPFVRSRPSNKSI